ncbi:LysR family transcriptional regulator [Methylobacterium tarhaniae]|uniref:LysR family transcriptional regulator n=1 Tax=Methylobacterium tarhaniae TaxID=1187852 RepID=A0A0J6TFD9_9HYPH|nr:LysR family transcriptional regulator [Methylobacterium tarhaniae]KMO44627.1 LysR family transcriptional regulator [Methylobacterium tarhaniae]
MAFTRRFLPSMSLLCAFEAASRHQSFTLAARELSLTQSAVSRQIRALEEMLGSDLFLRDRQTVRLTLAGETYAQEVREALRRISTATLGFRANPKGGTLNLAILPTFGTRWLAPRLPAFFAEHPGITVNLTTRLAPFDFRFEQVDAAIHFGSPDWPGAEFEPLMSETVVPACSRDLAERYAFAQASDLLRAPLLHLVSRPDAWERWFTAQGVNPEGVRGMLFDQFATVAQVAISGLGVALLPEFLIQPELARGDLVAALPARIENAGRYYLAWPSQRASHPPLEAFRAWLGTAAKAGQEEG